MEQDEIFTEAQMLIRKPAEAVYSAIAEPSQTTRFWFTKSSGPMKEGETLLWEWEMYNASAEIKVMLMQPFKLITFMWGTARKVEFRFEETGPSATYVTVRESGYTESGNDLIAVIKDSTGGFTTVLDGMKAWLEHGIILNLVADKFSRNA
jgi:uncharacterized protein YndB with AHSA1/START domain